MIIYKWQHKENGKCYIGQTTQDPNRRRLEHLARARNPVTTCHFHNALKKYGEESFTYEILEECNSLDELNKREIFWANKYDSIDNGYNTRGVGDNRIHSKESKKRMSEAQKAAHARRRANGGDTFTKKRKPKGWTTRMKGKTWKVVEGKRVWMEV